VVEGRAVAGRGPAGDARDVMRIAPELDWIGSSWLRPRVSRCPRSVDSLVAQLRVVASVHFLRHSVDPAPRVQLPRFEAGLVLTDGRRVHRKVRAGAVQSVQPRDGGTVMRLYLGEWALGGRSSVGRTVPSREAMWRSDALRVRAVLWVGRSVRRGPQWCVKGLRSGDALADGKMAPLDRFSDRITSACT